LSEPGRHISVVTVDNPVSNNTESVANNDAIKIDITSLYGILGSLDLSDPSHKVTYELYLATSTVEARNQWYSEHGSLIIKSLDTALASGSGISEGTALFIGNKAVKIFAIGSTPVKCGDGTVRTIKYWVTQSLANPNDIAIHSFTALDKDYVRSHLITAGNQALPAMDPFNASLGHAMWASSKCIAAVMLYFQARQASGALLQNAKLEEFIDSSNLI
jgi:hypothetical protein